MVSVACLSVCLGLLTVLSEQLTLIDIILDIPVMEGRTTPVIQREFLRHKVKSMICPRWQRKSVSVPDGGPTSLESQSTRPSLLPLHGTKAESAHY